MCVNHIPRGDLLRYGLDHLLGARLVQWREKQAQHKLAAAMLAVANAKHAVWRFADSTATSGGLTCEELAKLLRHQRLPVLCSSCTALHA